MNIISDNQNAELKFYDIHGKLLKEGDIVKIIDIHPNDELETELSLFREETFALKSISWSINEFTKNWIIADFEVLEENPGEFSTKIRETLFYNSLRNIYKIAARVEIKEKSALPEGYTANSLVQRGV